MKNSNETNLRLLFISKLVTVDEKIIISDMDNL